MFKIKISFGNNILPLSKFMKVIPNLIEKCEYDYIFTRLENEKDSFKTDIFGIKDMYQNLINHYKSLAKKDPRYKYFNTSSLNPDKKDDMKDYLDKIMGDYNKEKSSLLDYFDKYLNIINSEKQKLDFQKFIGNITICQLFGLKYEEDELLCKMKTEYEKCREVNKRLCQIVDAINNYSLTANDVIDIIGNVKINYLIKVFPKVFKQYKAKQFLNIN